MLEGCEHAKIHGASFGTVDITSKLAHEYNLKINTAEALHEWPATIDAWGEGDTTVT